MCCQFRYFFGTQSSLYYINVLTDCINVLTDWQADVLKFIRGHWEQLKGSIITDDGTYISLNLLNCCNSVS